MKKAKVLVQKGKTEYLDDLDKEVTIVKERKFFIDSLDHDYSTEKGMIKKADLKKTGRVKSSRGREFSIFDAGFVDVYKHLPKLAQTIPLKDIGYILVQTGIGPESSVVEGGVGSGGLALQLARYAKKVVSYELDKERIALVNESAKKLGITNLTIKNSDLYKKIDERGVDVVCIDVPEPWRAVDSAERALKIGGFLVSYSPTIIQSNQFIDTVLKKPSFIHIRTTEILDRPWIAEKLRVRPLSKEILHSGFITILRKIC